MEKLLAGAIPLILMALVADFCCEKAERRIVPRGLKMEKQT
jgi:ABC-type proline/glycine betaine transport system permease subunit